MLAQSSKESCGGRLINNPDFQFKELHKIRLQQTYDNLIDVDNSIRKQRERLIEEMNDGQKDMVEKCLGHMFQAAYHMGLALKEVE